MEHTPPILEAAAKRQEELEQKYASFSAFAPNGMPISGVWRGAEIDNLILECAQSGIILIRINEISKDIYTKINDHIAASNAKPRIVKPNLIIPNGKH